MQNFETQRCKGDRDLNRYLGRGLMFGGTMNFSFNAKAISGVCLHSLKTPTHDQRLRPRNDAYNLLDRRHLVLQNHTP